MMDLYLVPLSILVSGILGLYALAFTAGGIYHLEQRVARIRDQFPKQGPLAALTGYAALGIGLLAALSVGGHFVDQGADFHLGALVATVAGVGFWVYRVHIDLTPLSRIRDGALASICAAIAVLTAWWIKVI
jgi:hypothetical protein